MSGRTLLALIHLPLLSCAVGPDVDGDTLYNAYYPEASAEAAAPAQGYPTAPQGAGALPDANLNDVSSTTSGVLGVDAGVTIDPPSNVADAGLASPSDASPSSSPPDSSSVAVDAASSSTADAAPFSPADAGASPSEPSCSPATCTNRCLLLPRCCNADNQCACQDLLTRQCTLPSL